MRQTSTDQRSAEATKLAKAILVIPASDLAPAIRKMILQRKLSRTVVALDKLISKYPEHKQVGIKALTKLGLWWDSDQY
jgi:hypothetical protein